MLKWLLIALVVGVMPLLWRMSATAYRRVI